MGTRRRGNAQRTARGETPAQAHLRKRLGGLTSRRASVAYVRGRDHHDCRLCGTRVQYADEAAPDFGIVHAFRPPAQGGSDVEPNNLVLVCQRCRTGDAPCLVPRPTDATRLVIVPLDADALMAGPIVPHTTPVPDDAHPDPAVS